MMIGFNLKTEFNMYGRFNIIGVNAAAGPLNWRHGGHNQAVCQWSDSESDGPRRWDSGLMMGSAQ
jgi:hypothetical protein